jgi:hypothetical protein
MAVKWKITFDCAHPRPLAQFWALALGYAPAPPPEGFASWDEWSAHYGVPEEEWDDGAYLSDPDGIGPSVSFLRVPESKVAKNRLHMDLPVSGGRQVPQEQREPLIREAVERLTAAGATVIGEYDLNGKLDHFMMADPEGNEFCLV